MSKFQLFALLAHNGTPYVTINGFTGILGAVERESGNGSCFNVTLYTRSGTVKTFVRTID